MICNKCGSHQPDDAKFCSNCGSTIEVDNDEKTEETGFEQKIVDETENEQVLQQEDSNVTEEPISEQQTYQYVQPPKKPTITDKIKEKILSFWSGLDWFCKIETIAIIVVSFMLFIALCRGKVFPILISILQLGGLVVALLLHKEKIKCNLNWLKYAILALAVILTGLNISSNSWLNGINTTIFDTSKSDTPYSAQECIGKDKDVVDSDFSTAGFYNIDQEPIEDLEITETNKYGMVTGVSINGVSDFEGNTEYKSSSKVVIKYHAFKKIEVPLSSEEIKSMEADEVLKAFEDAGFFELSTDEKYDLDPDETNVEFENIISIGETESFEKGDKFSPNADIKLVTHRPYEKYNLKVIIDFVPNLIFSKYDVKFEIDGHTEKLTHGKDAEYEYRLKQGDYTLSFTSAESSSVSGSVELSLNGDTEACYKISCTSEKVNVETQYVENKGSVGENQAMIPSSASNCKYKNYKDIEKSFKNAGFTNIKTKILYDIYWGFTDEGEVDSVTVGGKTSFNRGDVVAKDSEIVITYHLKEEDDPNKKQETTSKSTDTTKATSTTEITASKNSVLTKSNCNDLKDLLSSKALSPENQSAFVSKYLGQVIEFDCFVYYLEQNSKYKTIYSYVLAPGDKEHLEGAVLFMLEDTSSFDFKWDAATRPDSLTLGSKIKIRAKVISGDDSLYIYLDPVKTWGR